MKEYLTKNSNGDYQLVNHRFSDNDIEIPKGAEIAYLHKDDGIEFSKMQEGEFYRYYWGRWHESSFDNIQELSQETFFDSVLWKRSTIVEYLNPTDWSLHVVDVDNDAVGEDWIKVPDGAEQLTKCGLEFVFWKDKGNFSWHTNNSNEWDDNIKHQLTTLNMYGMEYIVWQRHTQPEELPFVDDIGARAYDALPPLSFAMVDDEPKDNVNHPSHYTQGGIECIEAIKASMSHEAYCGYLKGNVQKYMWRYEHKGGVESLKKAQWYLSRLIEEQSQ